MIVDAYTTPGDERETALSVEALLLMMDQAGIDLALVAPQDREIACEHEAGNARMIEMAAGHPHRLVPACTVSPWRRDAQRMIHEAHRGGAKMLVLAPALQGFMMTDELVAPVCEAAAALNLPVYVHTGPHAHGAPSQVVLAAELFPCTRFILGHCGGTDHGWDMPAILRAHRPDNLWFELSLARPWAASGYVELAGADRLIWASGAPRNQPAFELEQLRSRLDAQAAPAILGTNAATLLNLGTP